MTARWAQPVAAVLVVLGTAALWLPWWTAGSTTYRLDGTELVDLGAERWRGIEVLGQDATVLAVVTVLVMLAVLVATLRGGMSTTAAWWVLGAAGAVSVALAAAGIAGWGSSAGAVGTLVCGLLVLTAVLWALVPRRTGFARLVPAAVVLLAVPVWFGPAATARDERPAAGAPLEKVLDITTVTAKSLSRTGDRKLRVTPGERGPVPVERGVGLATSAGLVTLDEAGRPITRVLVPHTVRVLGIVDGRLVLERSEQAQVWVLSLRAPGEPAVVPGNRGAAQLSPTGMLSNVDTSAPVDVTRLRPGQRVESSEPPDPTQPPDPAEPTSAESSLGDDVAAHPETGRLAWVDQTEGPGDRVVVDGAVLAGGLDPACGLTATAGDAFLSRVTDIAPARGGGWWLTEGQEDVVQLLRLTDDGQLLAGPRARLGVNVSLLTDDAGTLHIATRSGLFRLRDPDAALRSLPAPAADCAAHPQVAGPAALSALPSLRGPGTAIRADGTKVVTEETGQIVLVAPDGTERVIGQRTGPSTGGPAPDGSGGFWWVERIPAGTAIADETAPGPLEYDTYRLVHASGAGAVQPQQRTRAKNVGRLHTDLSGGQPLVGDCLRFAAGAVTAPPVLQELGCGSVLVGQDGQGWAVGDDDRLYALQPGGAAATLRIVPSTATDTPVAVQLAHGVLPAELNLREPSLGIDSTGRLLVLTEDVLLAVAPAGVTVLAQDERLRSVELQPVEGGTVVDLIELRTDPTYRLGY